MKEPELGAGIDPGMAINPFPSSIWIRRDSNPKPLDHESSLLTTRPDCRPFYFFRLSCNCKSVLTCYLQKKFSTLPSFAKSSTKKQVKGKIFRNI